MLKLNQFSDLPTFIISLERSEKRRQILRASDIPTSWVQNYHRATDLTDIAYIDLKGFHDEQSTSILYERQILGGEIGCALSHAKVADKIIKEKIEVALVLEDDIAMLPNQEEYLLEVYHKLIKLSKAGVDFICHLGSDDILVGDLTKLPVSYGVFQNDSIR